MKTPTPPDGTLLQLALDQVHPDPDNHRKSMTDEGLADLLDSMAAVGLLQPIVVRKLDEGGFRIVAGHRRHAAAVKLGWELIPAIIKTVDAERAADLALIENLQREDLAPIDEARGYQQLVDRGLAPADIAARLGRSRSSVYSRLALLDLPAEAQEALREGRLSAGVAQLIGRLPGQRQREEATQAVLSRSLITSFDDNDDDVVDPMSIARARQLIRDRFMLDLGEAPFDPADAGLVPAAGACPPCGRRTGNQVDLFGDMINGQAGTNLCTYAPCWEMKKDAHVERALADARERGLAILAPKQVAKILTSWGHLQAGGWGAWIDADEKRPGSKNTWRKSLGKKAPQEYAAACSEGKVVYLYRRKDVDEITGAGRDRQAPADGAPAAAGKAADPRKRGAEAARRTVALIIGEIASIASKDWPRLADIVVAELYDLSAGDDLLDCGTERPGLDGKRESARAFFTAHGPGAANSMLAEMALGFLVRRSVEGRVGEAERAVMDELEGLIGLKVIDVLREARDELAGEAAK